MGEDSPSGAPPLIAVVEIGLFFEPSGFLECTSLLDVPEGGVVGFGFPEVPDFAKVSAGALVGSSFAELLFTGVGFKELGAWLLPFPDFSGLELAEPEGFWFPGDVDGLWGASGPFLFLPSWLPSLGAATALLVVGVGV